MSYTPGRWRRAGVLAALVAAAAVMLSAGCAASDNSAPSGGAPAFDGNAEGGEGGAARAPAAAPDPDQQRDAPEAEPPQLEPQQRALIYTGTLTVTSRDVVKSADDAIALATAAGALVSADQRNLDADQSTVQLVFRVPSAKFASTLDALAELGNEESRQVQTQDVTEALVDLDARVATQQASVDRVRALLAQAKTIGEIVSLESELSRREADLDSLKQRRAKLGGLVSLSTITLNLRGPAAPLPEEEDETGFVAGLRDGWRAFLKSVQIVLTIAGFLLPWGIAIGVPIWLIVLFARRRGPRRPLPPGPPPTGGAPVPAPVPVPPAPPAPPADRS